MNKTENKETTKPKLQLSKPMTAIVIILIIATVALIGLTISKLPLPKNNQTDETASSSAMTDDEAITYADKYSSIIGEKPFIAIENTEDSDADSEEKEKNNEETTAEPLSQEEIDKNIDTLMSQMSLSEKIYQLMFVKPEAITGISVVTAAGSTTENALKKYPVGGIVYFAYNMENREQTIEMINNSQKYSAIPLFIGVDEEGGNVSRLGSNYNMGTTKHPAMADVGKRNKPQEAAEIGTQLATDLKSLGFNVDFAPCADVLVDADNSEIGNRSFGSDPKVCANMVQNVVLGLEENNVSATLKHFPGHASATKNTHDSPSESTRTLEELKSCEFLPFKSGIDVNVDFIMISHMTLVNATNETTVSSITKNEIKLPSSLSKEVITDWLIGELGYKGIIITDSLEMKAITNEFGVGTAAVRAIDAGADMILMTPDVKTAHDAIFSAIERGELTEERIDQSVRKILSAKYKNGIIKPLK